MMIIKKVLNNNAVAVITDDYKEAVLLGNGLGYKKQIGDEVSGKVEKTYYVQSDMQIRMLDLIENNKQIYFEIAEVIIKKAKVTLESEIDDRAIVSLADHIAFAVERLNKNIEIPDIMPIEIRYIYKEEFDFAKKALSYINRKLNVKLNDSELIYITMHLISANLNEDSKTTCEVMSLVNDLCQVIRDGLGLDLDYDNLNFSKLVRHLKLLANRILLNDSQEDGQIDELYEVLTIKEQNLKLVEMISQILQEKYNYTVNKTELVYLLVHTSRLK